jgi:para-aminobenzoate synthetase component 1
MPDGPRITPLPLKLEPGGVWARLAGGGADHLAFLDSALAGGRLGRFSILAWEPGVVLRTRGRRLEWRRDGRWTAETGSPFEALRSVLSSGRRERPRGCPIPFIGGGIGYLSYDLCHFVERLPSSAEDDLGLPELYFGFYDRALVYDHGQGRWWLSLGRPGPRGADERAVRAALESEPVKAGAPEPGAAVRSNFTRGDYERAIARAIEYIGAGDIFQVNLSQRFAAPWRAGAAALYARLRALNPAPFAAYLGFEGAAVASSSPERFLQVEGRHVETRPIKGTRPRGATEQEDRALAEELLASEKDRAELTMIVDLERNDLGRVCRYGSVRVPERLVLEGYETVYHLVATVVGDLHGGRDMVDLLRATFPGGSITGAPKVRAMEIIDELEPTRRSVYTGSVGYIGFDGRADLNIAIRTVILRGETAYYQAGGGIVADSRPALEYEETLHKARAFRWLAEGKASEQA